MAVKKKIVVVGLGSIGKRHARLLKARADTEVMLCEPHAENLAQAQQELGPLPSMATFEAAVASHPDMLLIATPHSLHADQTIQALKLGIPVLCEKPMADSLAAARRMVEANERTGTLLSIAFMLHFHPGVRRLKQLIDSGELGAIISVRWSVGTYVTLVNSKSRYQRDLRGALLMDYAHQPDLIHYLLGKRPIGVYMSGVQGGDMELSSNPNTLTLLCDYAEPLTTAIHLNYIQVPDRHECELVGEAGWVVYDLKSGALRIGRRDKDCETVEQINVERDALYTEEHRVFFDAVAGKCPPSSPPAEAIVSMEIVEAGLRSWNEKRRVDL